MEIGSYKINSTTIGVVNACTGFVDIDCGDLRPTRVVGEMKVAMKDLRPTTSGESRLAVRVAREGPRERRQSEDALAVPHRPPPDVLQQLRGDLDHRARLRRPQPTGWCLLAVAIQRHWRRRRCR